MMNGNESINEAARLIYGERSEKYGNASDDFSATAAMWTAFLRRRRLLADGAQLDAHCIAIMMTLLKISREAHMQTDDNIVDGIGYLALAADVRQ